MNSLKPYALIVAFCLLACTAIAQSVLTLEPGTFSNRTTDGLNNAHFNPVPDPAPVRTWSFYDYTSGWDSKYYNGDVTKPAYTEGWLSARYNLGQPVTDGFTMNYRLLFPVGYNQAEAYKYPLIIFMHGLGESGQGTGSYTGPGTAQQKAARTDSVKRRSNDFLNNDKNLIHGGQAHLNAVYLANGKKAEDPTLLGKSFPGFVLIPQQAVGQWYDGSQTTTAIAILKKVIETYNVDPNRVYIHGLSNGGQAVWYMVKSNPELFAAALPMSATVAAGDDIFNSQVNKAVPIPLWMFQGGLDTSPSPNQTGQMVSKLRTAGADVRYTVYPNIGHGVWGTAYAEPDFFSWMLTHNKSDITVLYQNPTICPTTGAGAKLAVGTGFMAYQWEKDGVIISGETTNTYTAATAGSYRARFSRVSATPTEAQWNQWSKPVVISETAPITPIITATSSPHLKDINAINSGAGGIVRIEGPTDANLDRDWYENGTLVTNLETSYREVGFNQWVIGNQGTFTQTLKVKQLSGCPSLFSNPIYITTGTPTTLAAPTNLQATVTGAGSIQLFWTDNANTETGYEVERATNANGPYTFYKLLGEDVVAYHDTGLIPNTTYYYKIRAVNNIATSPYNASALVAATSDDTAPPTAPQNLVKILNSTSSIKLGWKASTDNSGVKKYMIYYDGNTVDTGSADTTYTITDLTVNTNYTFTVKAVDNNNTLSQPSNQLLASTFFTGLDFEHTPDNVGDGNTHSPENSVYGIDWGYKEHTGHVDNVTIAPRVQDNYFNFKFNGYIRIPTTGTYSFRLSANDAANLYLGVNFPYRNSSTAFTYPGQYSYWTAINSGMSANVRFVNPNVSNTLFAATDNGVFKATFNTTTGVWNAWTASSTGLTNTDVRFIVNSGTTTFFAATAAGVFVSTNAAATWTQVNNGLANLDVRHLHINGSNLYASTAGGIFLSVDNGATWAAMNTGLTNTDVRYVASTGSGATITAFAATAGGIFLSTNGGNWSVRNTGLTNTDVRCLNILGSNIFAGTASGLFLSTNTGSNWSAINTGLSNTSILSLVSVSNGANNLFAGTPSGAYMFSYNVQNTWTARPIGLANTNINSISISGGNMFAGTPSGAMLSINSGANWATTNRFAFISNSTGVNTCQQIVSNSVVLNSTIFYPISIIYYDLVDDECLTLEYRMGSNAWAPVPDSFFSTGTPPVPAVPVVPGNLVAVSTGMSSIQLNWTHALATDDFEIYRSTDNVNYAIVATVTEDGTTSYADTSLTPGSIYYYKIRAINATGGTSAYTTPVNATTDPDSEAPSIPLNVVVVTNTYTNAGLQWSASTDNVQVAGYKVFVNGDLLGTSNVTTFSTTSLSPSTSYSFTVKAYDLNGNESGESAAAIIVTTGPATFYSKTSADLSLLASWGTATNGTGTAPTNFSFNGQQFIVRSNATLSNAWVIGGNTSRVVVNPNVTLTLQNKLTGKINLLGSASVIVNYSAPDFNYDFDAVSATSNITFNTYSAIPMDKYGNVTLNGTGVKTIPSGTMEVQGTLTLASGIELKGAAANGTTVKIKGNLTTGTTPATVSADNLVSLQFTENDFHNFTLTSNQNFYKLAASANSTVSISGTSKNIKVGSLNGGGLDLAEGSILTLGDNTLVVAGAGTINNTNNTGQLSMLGGDIQLTTSSSSPSNLYFVPDENKIQTLTLQSTGGGLTTIREPLEIYNGLKINSGILDASGNVIIKSSADSSASIREIENGSIIGNVTVERYIGPDVDLYRYLSSPVAAVTVADWQPYIPITGAFTGGTASMHTYAEPNYIPFPVTAATEQLEKGRGYATYIWSPALPTLVSTGVPHQGTVSFTSLLTPGTGASTDGWNLLGNPYASDIVWNSTDWTSSGIGNVIAISDNTSGVLQYHYWDRSGAGSGGIERGKIPAGQAFWVQTTNASPSLSVNESAKTTDPASDNTEFYRVNSARVDGDPSFSFELDNGVNKDVTYVKFTGTGSDSYSKQNDGVKRPNSFFNLSTSSTDNVALAMNDLSIEFCEKVIPVNIQNTAAGTYTLRFNGVEDFELGIITLEDKYLATSQVISSQNKEFIISVDGQAASTQNRFFLKLTHSELLTNKSVVADKTDYCSSENFVTLTIPNSQPEVVYEAFITSSVSEKVTGTGEAIQLQVPVSALGNNTNVITVKASFPGCIVNPLAKTATVNKTTLPELTGDTDYSGCVESAMDIKVSSSTATSYQWTNQTTDQILADTDNTITISSLLPSNYYKVVAINEKGCASAPKYILVRADSLTMPAITASNDVLKTVSTSDIQWLLNGEVIEGATSKEHTPKVSGSYTVRAVNNYCTKESIAYEYIITGVGETGTDEFSLNVYPNPASTGQVNITGKSKSTTNLQLQLLDLTGKNQITRTLSYEEYAKGIIVSDELPVGMYIVRITQDNKTLYQKLVLH